jgi:NTP pyrophosphatase (non-canonical NTP hydrolase)
VTLEEYQALAARTMNTPGVVESPERLLFIATMGLGLTGEAGEVADYMKKVLGHGHPLDVSVLKRELGDVLWYVAALASLHGLGLEDVARTNVEKLRARYPEGFTKEASLNRGGR